jgi:hypothetical protein
MSDSVMPAESGARRNAVFAAGHLGELTRQLPVELIDAVLTETNTVERRLRDLPSRVGVYFVLALCLFPGLGYRKMWAKLTATVSGRKTPSEKAFRDLRRRLGATPLKALFGRSSRGTGHPRRAVRALPHRCFRRVRVVQGARHRPQPVLAGQAQSLPRSVTGYPVVRLMTVVGDVDSRPGIDPDRASFTTALETVKDLLINAANVADDTDLVGRIGCAVLSDLLPSRRPRTSVRKVKSPLSRYNKKDPYRPQHSTPVTSITATITEPAPKHATHQLKSLTTALGP